MASVLKVDKLDPQSGTALEIGSSGDTITIPSGATFTQSGTMNASAITAGTLATARGGAGMVKLYQNDWSGTPVDSIASGAVFTSDYHFYKVYLYSAVETLNVRGKVWLTDGGVDIAESGDYWTAGATGYIDIDNNNTAVWESSVDDAQSYGSFWIQYTHGTTKAYPNALELTIFDPLGGVVDNSNVVNISVDACSVGGGNKVFREVNHIVCLNTSEASADGIRFALSSDGYIYGQIEIYGMKRA